VSQIDLRVALKATATSLLVVFGIVFTFGVILVIGKEMFGDPKDAREIGVWRIMVHAVAQSEVLHQQRDWGEAKTKLVIVDVNFENMTHQNQFLALANVPKLFTAEGLGFAPAEATVLTSKFGQRYLKQQLLEDGVIPAQGSKRGTLVFVVPFDYNQLRLEVAFTEGQNVSWHLPALEAIDDNGLGLNDAVFKNTVAAVKKVKPPVPEEEYAMGSYATDDSTNTPVESLRSSTGRTLETGVWSMQVNSWKSTFDINQNQNEYLHQVAADGEMFVIVNFTLANRSKQTQTFSSLFDQFKLVTRDGTVFDPIAYNPGISDPFQGGQISPGLKTTGDIVFVVPLPSQRYTFLLRLFGNQEVSWELL
jgi:hypothetical protein